MLKFGIPQALIDLWNNHVASTSNPHNTTASQVGAYSTSQTDTLLSAKQSTSEKGQNNGYASLDSSGKIPIGQMPLSVMEYKGTWNASTNTPTLIDGTGNTGDFYRVSVAGTQNLGSGSQDFAVRDGIVYNGSTWDYLQAAHLSTATTTVAGITTLATNAEVIAETVTNKIVSPSSLSAWFADVKARSTVIISGIWNFSTGIVFTNTSKPSYTQGRVFWDDVEKAVSYYNERSGITVNMGQETVIRVKNTTGSTLSNGRAVYISGSDGTTGVPLVSYAQANQDSTAGVVAILTEDIANNAIGYATKSGRVHELDTSAFAAGTQLYLSATSAGVLTATMPNYPNRRVSVAKVITSNSTTGVIEVIIGGVGIGSQVAVYNGATFKQTPIVWTGTATTTGGVATFFPTLDGTNTGTAIFTNIYAVTATAQTDTATATAVPLASVKAIAANRKSITVNCVDGLTAVLASPTMEFSANGTTVNLIIWGD